MFSAVIMNLKKGGKGSVKHKQPLSSEDFKKLYSSDLLNVSRPEGLQNKVFIDIMIHLCNRGRENLREMKTNDFTIQRDCEGNRHFLMLDKLTKNHRGETTDKNSQKGRIYETSGLSTCPVSSYEQYVAKLHPECDNFWQQPNRNFKTRLDCQWYCNVPLGNKYSRSKN